MEEQAKNGRRLVLTTGVYHHATMAECSDVIEWLRENREHRDRYGECRGGCDKEQVPHEVHGHAVCPVTYQPCEKWRLRELKKREPK